MFWRVLFGSLLGRVLGALVIAICLALGFGPDKWAAFIITGFPHWVTPGLAQEAFLILGVTTLGLISWPLIRSRVLSLWHSKDIDVKATRAEWWYSNIQCVIRSSEKLVVMDSVIGQKPGFWDGLSDRLDSAKPFHLVYLMLSDDSPFLQRCLQLVRVPASLTDQDKAKIGDLRTKNESLDSSKQKTLEFYFWEGISPGPLVAWTINGKETIGLGFWMELEKATDGTPYVIVKRGPLFANLKDHYEAIIKEARFKKAHVLPRAALSVTRLK